MYEPVVEEHGRAIHVAPSQPILFPLHRERLGQALGNLIDNSLKYGAGDIRLSARPRPEGVLIEVADAGAGIAADRRAEAVRRFGRLDEARSGGGAGLGLSLVAAPGRDRALLALAARVAERLGLPV